MSDLVAGEGRVCFISLCGCNYDVFQVGFERNKKVSDGGGRQEKLFAKCFSTLVEYFCAFPATWPEVQRTQNVSQHVFMFLRASFCTLP